ncbi:hypothetical protein C8T65DRAFT_569461, partial [Cerioporus squamosus]
VIVDYFKAANTTNIFVYAKLADKVIKTLRSRTYLLALLRDIQEVELAGTKAQPKTIIKGVITRWTTNYGAYCRVLELQVPLMKLASDTRLFDSGDEESHEKVREMVDIIRGHGGEANALFWHGLARYIVVHRIKRHLEPLAIASHITQADTCRLDDVLLTFGHLYKFYSELDDPVDVPARTAVLRSLEKRWSKADQDVFVAATLFNPYRQRDPFNNDLIDLLAPAHVHILADRLWNRFFPHDTDDSKKPTFRMVCDYLEQKGIYAHMKITMNAIAAEARSKVCDERTRPHVLTVFEFPGRVR